MRQKAEIHGHILFLPLTLTEESKSLIFTFALQTAVDHIHRLIIRNAENNSSDYYFSVLIQSLI